MGVVFLNANRLIEIDKTKFKNPESIQSKKKLNETDDESFPECDR
jgi:hypothetical protein